MNTYFTSDSHYNHENVIRYCNRPFANAKEMDEAMIEKWNAKVKPGDVVYHLGDFGFAQDAYLEKILRQLQGQKHFIYGNHDKSIRKNKTLQAYFQTLSELKEIKIGDTKIVLCHYSMNVWNKSHYGAYQLFGHSHGTLPIDMTKKNMDVGVDCNNFEPISFEEVKIIMDQRKYIPVDHHGMEKDNT